MPRLRHDKLTVNALSLLVAMGVTGLGILVFWEVVAHERSAQSVGTAFAEVSALTFISMIATLNLNNVFIRFLPASGRLATRFVWRGYVAVAIIGIAVGVGYVATGLAATIVPAHFPDRVLFVAAVPIFAVFTLEDSVLTALRITHWVPLENGITVLARILMLPVLVFLPARSAILLAWIGPAALAVIIVNGYLFGHALPARPHRDGDGLPPWRRLASFVVAEYLTSLFGAAVLQVMPLIVVSRLGATEGGYFALPWLICTSITVFLWSVGASFIVEVVTAGEYSMSMMARSLRLWGVVCVVSMFGVLVVGPFVLQAAGHGYASHATVFLLIIGVSVPFGFVRVLYSAFTWLEQRVWMLLGITIVSAAALLGLTLALLRLGLAGVGWAYLISQVVGAALMGPAVWSRLREIRMADGPVRLQGAI